MTTALEDFDQASETLQKLVERLRPEHLLVPTPCSDWNVRQLLNHLVHGNLRFSAMASGEPAPEPGADLLGDDPGGAVVASCRKFAATMAAPGMLQRELTHPSGPATGEQLVYLRVFEVSIHTWDLSQATGMPVRISEPIAEASLERLKARLPADNRPPGLFAPPQPVAEGASVLERLVAYSGRSH